MVKQLSSVPWNRFFKRAEDSVTRGHSWKLVKESCRSDCRLHFFSQRVINRWNSLSQDDIDAATINSFKNRLEMRRKRRMDFFKDWMSTSPLAAREWWNWWMLMARMIVPGAAAPGELCLCVVSADEQLHILYFATSQATLSTVQILHNCTFH